MLIYSDRYRGWGKQKPKQWGPLSAVQSAVFANAGRMGIPIPVIYFPMWEAAGQTCTNIGSISNTGTINTPQWVNSGLNFTSRSYITSSCVALQSQTVIVGLIVPPTWTEYYPMVYYNGTVGSLNGELVVAHASVSRRVNFVSGSANARSNGALSAGEHQICAITGGGFKADLFIDGKHDNVLNETGGIASAGDIMIGGRTDLFENAFYNGGIRYFILFADYLNTPQLSQLHETPYALLQPVSVPYIFDLGATTGTTVTIYADSRARISNSFFKTADTLAGISNINSLFADSLSGVSNTRDISADTLTGVSNTEFEIADSQAGVSNIESEVADYLAAISNSGSLFADTKAITNNVRSILADSLAQLSNTESSTADSNISVSNEITRLIDTSVQIGTEGTVTVSFDTLAKISNVLSIKGDTRQSISNTAITEADCKAIVSELVSTTADSKTRISNTEIIESDTKAIISGLVQVIVYCDSLLSISNNESASADTSLSIYDVVLTALSKLSINRYTINTTLKRPSLNKSFGR